MKKITNFISKFWDGLSEEVKVAGYIALSGILAQVLKELDAVGGDNMAVLIVSGVINVALVFLKNQGRAIKKRLSEK